MDGDTRIITSVKKELGESSFQLAIGMDVQITNGNQPYIESFQSICKG